MNRFTLCSRVIALALVGATMSVVPASADLLMGTWEGHVSCKGTGLTGRYTIYTTDVRARMVIGGDYFVAAEFEYLYSTSPSTEVPPGVNVHFAGMCGRYAPEHNANGPDLRGQNALVLGTLGAEQAYDVDFPVLSVLFRRIEARLDDQGYAVEQNIRGTAFLYPTHLVGACKVTLTRVDDAVPAVDPGLMQNCGFSEPSLP